METKYFDLNAESIGKFNGDSSLICFSNGVLGSFRVTSVNQNKIRANDRDIYVQKSLEDSIVISRHNYYIGANMKDFFKNNGSKWVSGFKQEDFKLE